jgi:hypothetical protein
MSRPGFADVEALLAPQMEEIRRLLSARCVAITLLGPRNASEVPDITDDIENQEQVHRLLNHGPLRSIEGPALRTFTLREDGAFEVKRGVAHGTSWASGFINYVASKAHEGLTYVGSVRHPAPKWEYLVRSSGLDILSGWNPRMGAPLLFPLRYIVSDQNRDIVGFFSADIDDMLTIEQAGRLLTLIELYLVPLLRNLCEMRMREMVAAAKTREEVLMSVLDAALALTGADWGCIKTGCLGVQPVARADAKDTELVRAECVLTCPLFFHEGRLEQAESLVGQAIGHDTDLLMGIDPDVKTKMKHPAWEIFITLIRDASRVSEPFVAIKGGSDVIGALVVQHTSVNYLAAHKETYEPFLKRLCASVPVAIRSIAAIPMHSILQHPKISVEDIEKRAHNLVAEVFGEFQGWILLETRGADFHLLAESKPSAGHLQSLIGYHPKIGDYTSILGTARDNKAILFTSEPFDSEVGHASVKRANGDDGGTQAHFSDKFKAATENEPQKLIFDIGSSEALRNPRRIHVSIIVGPIIFPTGLPVGILAVARSQGIRPRQVHEFQKGLQQLAEPLWARAKGDLGHQEGAAGR